jgi:cytochrome b561
MTVSTEHYTRTAITLHWLIALLVLCLVCVGFYMTGLRISPIKLQIYMLHKSVGLTVLALMLIRLAWRWSHPAPALPASMPAWQRHASASTHALLYLTLFAMPLSGWLMNSASGFPTKLYSVVALPNLIAKDPEVFTRWQTVHAYLAYLLVALVSLHIGAALKHAVFDRDRILARMWPGL